MLYERHVDALYRYCFRRCANWATAEDQVAQVFLEAWKRRRDVRIDDDLGLRPWLFGIALNVSRNHARAVRRSERLRALNTSQTCVPDFAEASASRLDDEEVMRRILEAISVLSPDDQVILQLCIWEELTPSQASVALGITPGNARVRLSRAKRRLRELVPMLDPREAVR